MFYSILSRSFQIVQLFSLKLKSRFCRTPMFENMWLKERKFSNFVPENY